MPIVTRSRLCALSRLAGMTECPAYSITVTAGASTKGRMPNSG
jgi:hypothetical protein